MMVKKAVKYAAGLHQHYAQTKENIDNYFEDSIDDLEVYGIDGNVSDDFLCGEDRNTKQTEENEISKLEMSK